MATMKDYGCQQPLCGQPTTMPLSWGCIKYTISYHIRKPKPRKSTPLHTRSRIPIKDRCRYFAQYLAEHAGIPYQAVWAMSYRILSRQTGVDLVNLPGWHVGSTLTYVARLRLCAKLFLILTQLEKTFL